VLLQPFKRSRVEYFAPIFSDAYQVNRKA
jgi:hypothetical protein